MISTLRRKLTPTMSGIRQFSLESKFGQASLTSELFGRTETGIDVTSYTIKNNRNMSVEIINYGGHIRKLMVPKRNGEATDIVTGLDSIEAYSGGTSNNPYFGCITGRFANRIAFGKFSIGDESYSLSLNDGVNTLHGGPTGLHTRMWKLENEYNNDDEIGINLRYICLDMEEGYPGELDIIVNYSLNKNDNTLNIRYKAVTDSENGTVVNLTNHSYFNLNDNNNQSKFSENALLNSHELFMRCKYITPINDNLIPTGKLLDVGNTAFDFYNRWVYMGEMINDSNDEQLKNGQGYDHNFVIEKKNPKDIVECTKVRCRESGIEMAVNTSEPGIQFYSGNFLDGTITGKGHRFNRRSAFCLETQHFPDAPNQPSFPSTLLKKGEEYNSYTNYSFSICEDQQQ